MPQGTPYQTRGTTTNFQLPAVKQFEQDQKKQLQKQECEANGGVWDGNKCILPKSTDEALVNKLQTNQIRVTQPNQGNQQNQPNQQPINGRFDEKRGGFVTDSGEFYPTGIKSFVPGRVPIDRKTVVNEDGTITVTAANGNSLTFNRKDYNQTFLKGDPSLFSLPNNAQLQQQQIEAQAQQNLQTAQGLQGAPQLTEQDILNAVPQEPGFENLQAGAAGIGAGITGIGGGAALGAAIGTITLPGIGTVSGALLGGIAGGVLGSIGGAYTPITADARGDVKQAKKVGQIANTNFGQTIDSLNAGLITPEVALQRWKKDRTALYAARANLKRSTQTDLDRFISGGADELAQIEDYILDFENIYTNEFNIALASPNPAAVKYIYQKGESTVEE